MKICRGKLWCFEFMFPIVCIHDFKEVMRNFRIHMEAFFFCFLWSWFARKYRRNNFWKLAYRLLSKDLVVYTNIKSPIMYITTMYRFVFKKLFIILQFIDPIKILYYKVVKQALNKQVYFYIWSLWTWSLEKAKILFLFESRKQRS